MLKQSQLSHGAMVLTCKTDLLQSRGANLLSEQKDKLVFSLAGATLTLPAVEESGLYTAQMKNVLESKVDSYQNKGSNFVNFSSTLEPFQKRQVSK